MPDTLTARYDKAVRLRELRRQIAAIPDLDGPADFAARNDPGYRTPAHVKLLSKAVAETVADGGRLIVSMPPRVGKSVTTSLWTPTWYLHRWPTKRVILASHEANYAISWGRRTRDIYRRLFDGVSPDVSAAGEWETTSGGGMLSRGIGSAITGRGADLFLIDDPIKDFAQAHSAAIRQSQWEWWLSVAQTRLEPGAAVVVVMTRWHRDDLVGRLTSPDHEGAVDDWRVLRIPAIGEGPLDDPTVAGDALERDAGTPLTLASVPETEDEAIARWDRLRTSVGSYVWASLFQQRPAEREGAILRRDWWHYYRREGDVIVRPGADPVPISQLRVVQSWDLAVKDAASSDYVVGQVWGAHGADRFLLDQYRDRVDFVGTKTAMRNLRDRWPQTEVTWIEDKANGPAIISDLKRDLSGLVPSEPRGSKVTRAYGIQGDLEAGNIWLPEPGTAGFDVRELVQEAADFPNGAHDDQVDALTQAILNLRKRGTTTVHIPTGQLTDGASGRTRQARARIAR